MRLNYQQYGNGPALIIIHGLFGEGENWRTMALRLGRVCRVYTVDLRNHGHSPHTDEVSLKAMAADIRELLDMLSLERADILGHSMGGKVAMQLAADYPDRVCRLIVVDVAPQTTGGAFSGLILHTLHGVDLQGFRSRREIDEALEAAIPDRRARLFLMKDVERRDDGTFRWRIGIEQLYRNREQLRREVELKQPFTRPSLFVLGENSDYVTSADGEDIRTWYPHAQVVTIHDAGHWVHVDAPREFESAVIGFLESERNRQSADDRSGR